MEVVGKIVVGRADGETKGNKWFSHNPTNKYSI